MRRAGDRFVTRAPGLTSWHSFSYGAHYDPANTHFGLLLAANEDVLAPGAGFDEHPHRDIEVVTWVLAGALAHEDSAGHRGRARPGVVQRMSAGGGIRHAERVIGPEPAHYLQMWLWPQVPGGPPRYDTVDVTADLAAGRLVAVAPLRQPDATLLAVRLPAGRTVPLPAAPRLHVFAARGEVELVVADLPTARSWRVTGVGPEPGGPVLAAGDAARLAGEGSTELTARTAAEVLTWVMHGTIAE